MSFFTWRRLAGMLTVMVPAFFAVLWIVVIAMEKFYVRREYAVQLAVLTLLGAILPAWTYGEEIFRSCAKLMPASTPRWWRPPAAAFVGWAAAVLLAVWTFEPFGRYMDASEWRMVAKIVVFPWVLAAILFWLYRWAKK